MWRFGSLEISTGLDYSADRRLCSPVSRSHRRSFTTHLGADRQGAAMFYRMTRLHWNEEDREGVLSLAESLRTRIRSHQTAYFSLNWPKPGEVKE